MRIDGNILKEKNHGLVIGNSVMSGEVTANGDMFRRIVYNPSCFEMGKNEPVEAGFCTFGFFGTTREQLKWTITEHTYPRYRAETVLENGLAIRAEAICPLDADDCETMFLPAVLIDIKVLNNSAEEKSGTVDFAWEQGELGYDGSASVSFDRSFIEKGESYLACFSCGEVSYEAQDNALGCSAEVRLAPNEEKSIAVCFGVFDRHCRARTKFYTTDRLVSALRDNEHVFLERMQDFIDKIPDTGNAKIKEYTRWYMQAAILLTKSDDAGETITMGYRELNQRDSYWTSFVHLTLWPELEREMIRVSMRWQRPDGKIPTTILPLIEREYDIDINEYFCLRILRYYHWHRDTAFLASCYPAYVRSVRFIESLDRDNDALPEQREGDFWADWKDVKGIVGRKLAPHFCLLWLAVLKGGSEIARLMGDGEFAAECDTWYKKAEEKINRSFEEGGLWYEDHYIEQWYDGKSRDYVLQDQNVGVLFGVIPAERIEMIYNAMSANETDHGIRETYPYRQGDFGYEKGTYHNGGIWPYLMFMDVMGRYRTGHYEKAEELILKTGFQDLEKTDHWSPNEYLSGETGENMGFEVQGWSAALYGSMLHGAFRIRYADENTIAVKVNFQNRDFSTLLVLPPLFGTVRLSGKGGRLTVEQPKNGKYHVVVE